MALAMFLRRLGREETVHGFRSSFRDWAAESGFSHEVSEAALAHMVENKVERAYRRTDLFERRREVMTAWSKFLMMETNTVQGSREMRVESEVDSPPDHALGPH